eukprot:m.22749 g.22749  ORF g.22749 m.22749 type:complete len:500 (-) comp7433_c0_seq1:53-1552(-)
MSFHLLGFVFVLGCLESSEGQYYPGPPIPSHVMTACQTATKFDPANLQRPGGNYITLPLAQNASIEDCATLCCKDWNCAAFSFNLGEDLCKKLASPSSKCCSLKNENSAPVNNTYGAAVRTGWKASLPGPTPPFEMSTKFSKVTFDNQFFTRVEGDTWPTTWLADDTQLSSVGDSRDEFGDSPMAMYRVYGTPDPHAPNGGSNYFLKNVTGGNPVDRTGYCQSVPGSTTVKPTSVISVNGTIYWGIACMNYGDNKYFKRQHNTAASIAVATDSTGDGWKFNATNVDFFTGRLSAPMFIQFGRDNELAVDDYVYVHFPYSIDEYTNNTAESYWNNNDYVLLGRVHKEQVLVRSSWEFWSGPSTWTKDETMSKPIMTFPEMLGMNQVNFHKESKRYILANYGFIDLNGLPRPWHQAPEVYLHRTQLTIFEAENPWGPFRLFHRDDDWRLPDGSGGGYCPVMPPKWMTGTSAWMVSAQCCAHFGPTPHHYNFTTQQFHFELN